MEKPILEYHPSVFNALFPKFLKNFIKWGVAAIIVWLIFQWALVWGLTRWLPWMYVSNWRLFFALLVIALFFTLFPLKFEIVGLHRTTYRFYDSYVVEEEIILNAKRRSLPYSHITRIVNDRTLWNRITHASDIKLYSSLGEESIIMRSIKNSNEVERKIYELIKKHTKSHGEEPSFVED